MEAESRVPTEIEWTPPVEKHMIPAPPGWRLIVLGPDETISGADCIEACPIVAWEERGDDAYLSPYSRLHSQDGYGVAVWSMAAARVVGLLAPGEEMDSSMYEAAKVVAESRREALRASQGHA